MRGKHSQFDIILPSVLENRKKLVCTIRDNGSNFVAGLRDAGLPDISCLAHTLQLVIDDGVFAQPCVVNLFAGLSDTLSAPMLTCMH